MSSRAPVTSPDVSRKPSPPALYVSLLAVLPAVVARFKAMRLTGHIARSWTVVEGAVLCTLTFHLDPQSDQLTEDWRRARQEARVLLIHFGFTVKGDYNDPRILRVCSFHGVEIRGAA